MAAKRRRKKKSTAAGPLIVILVVLAAVILVCVIAARQSGDSPSIAAPAEKKADRIPQDVQIAGVDISGMAREKALALLKEQEDLLADDYEVTLVYGDYSRTASSDELGIGFDTEELLDKAKSGDRLEITASFSDQAIADLAQEAAEAVEVPVKEPTVSDFDFDDLTFDFDEGQDGLSVDVSELKTDILSLLQKEKKGTLTIQAEQVLREKDPDELWGHFGEISSFSTYCTNNENSEHNMRLAMEYMDGSVIEAGGIFSFNTATGDSTTPDGGWVQSGAWVQGSLQDQYGGGLCQAATTFYIAALYGNMEVIERWEHMQPSSYCEIGLDATIDYPGMDLKMMNTTDYPIYVVSKMYDKTLTVTLYGYISDEYDYITVSGWQTEAIPVPEAEYETDESMEEGAFELTHRGYSGSRAQAERQWIGYDGSVIRTEQLPSSSYSAVAPKYRIGPNTDKEAIPEGEESGTVSDPEEESSSEDASSEEEDPGDDPSGEEESSGEEDPSGETEEGSVESHEDPELIRG